jgi:hypothetical protein
MNSINNIKIISIEVNARGMYFCDCKSFIY